MYFVAAIFVYPGGAVYAAGHHEIDSLGVAMCRYGSTFCDNPLYLLVGAALAPTSGPSSASDDPHKFFVE